MDIIQAIKKDHEHVMQLFGELESSSSYSAVTRRSMLEELVSILEVHTSAEEQALYKSLLDIQHLKNEVLEGFEEHELAEDLSQELMLLDPSNELWVPKLKILRENVEHHIREEESQLLRHVESEFTYEDLKEMGREFLRAKENIERYLDGGVSVFA
jgi:hypothetical protein